MQFQITITHKGQQMVMRVRRAVYFDMTVFQVSTHNLKAIVYQKNGKWQCANDKLTEQELLDTIGAAILDSVGVEQVH